ncbi:histidine kinase [Marivirga tractuosa]|uniref:histidine kinase n=1 Tax=Marivirga tractuosa (strain ATCC 23168 / DSM 4126 / NBRC 15989 / NCIMB 1408 / VKM B-1430 / H-43) TaxID=643867 RepID=E4TU76_MARTH|nr:sensor histidine kinase [Marivirga tractuosa]ADR21004.1 integral membrane sensor signal transduction histidine kinase [Marivirga tractuosa DSM 4126]BDD14541.1 histidine kinase [Marivirga tractuosa]
MWKQSLSIFFTILFTITSLAHGQRAVFNLQQSNLNDEIVLLQGEWQFEYGELLSAEEMRELKSPVYIEIPKTWTGIEYKGEELPSTGYATYYAQIIVDKSISNLALNGKVQSTNYKLFVNGKELGEVGKLGTSDETAEPDYQNKIFSLPVDDTLDIVFQISNFHYRKGGMSRPPELAEKELLIEDRGQNISLSFFLIGSIFFMGLYHLGSNFFRTRNRMNTYFALVCLFTILRALSVNEYLLIDYLNFPWWLSTRIELISFYLIFAFTIRFIYYLFPEYIPKFFASIPYYIGISATVITLFTPILYNSNLVPIMQLVTVITGIAILYFIFRASLKGNKEVIIALIGFLLLFAVTVIEILIHQSHIVGEMVFALGIFFYLFSHVIILANRQNQTYIKNQDLSLALQQSNQRLERTVEERTKELNERNKELVQNNEELKKIHDEKNGLIHVLAHDLKSPLNNNKGLIQLVRMPENLTEDQKDYLNKLEKSNQQGIQLIEDLLQLYRMESQQKAEIEAIDVGSYFDELIQKHEDTAKLKSIKIETKIEPTKKAFYTDPDKLQRIMDNLISNALKFSYEESTIYLKIKHEGHQLHIEVKDEGMGILKEEQPKIFQKFQKMSNKPTAGESTSGLGLSIVKTLVEQLEGTIEFESAPRKGTSFKVSLEDLKSDH